VMSFGPAGLEEVGKFIDKGGNNLWGVEQFTTPQGERLVAASDRDFGLYLFRYTGPGAAVPPKCEDVAVSTTPGTPVTVPLTCTDANNNTLTLSIVSGPASGTLGAINQSAGSVTYTPNAGFTGTDTFTFRANDGAANSNVATATITVGRRVGGPCSNPIVGTNGDDLLEGTSAGDLILGRRGDDRIFGRRGADCLRGERGRDRLSGGRGKDRISGGRGADRIDAENGRDRAFGGNGDDRIEARDGKRDRIDCGRGFDTVEADRKDSVRRCERKR
jgi:Ca2+-binding RTX toxin-like protein